MKITITKLFPNGYYYEATTAKQNKICQLYLNLPKKESLKLFKKLVNWS